MCKSIKRRVRGIGKNESRRNPRRKVEDKERDRSRKKN